MILKWFKLFNILKNKLKITIQKIKLKENQFKNKKILKRKFNYLQKFLKIIKRTIN